MWRLIPCQEGKFPGTESQLLNKPYFKSAQEFDFKIQVPQLQENEPVETWCSEPPAEEHWAHFAHSRRDI
jgi:hypothetical protein